MTQERKDRVGRMDKTDGRDKLGYHIMDSAKYEEGEEAEGSSGGDYCHYDNYDEPEVFTRDSRSPEVADAPCRCLS